jgi:hypothetical protein
VPVSFDNNLFERSSFYAEDSAVLSLHNNLFRYSDVQLDCWAGTGWVVADNFFDSSANVPDSTTTLAHGYNAYLNTTRFNPTNTTDKVITNFLFASGALGKYYQGTNLMQNAGSRGADLAGLYHYTTRINQIKETNSVVDIGYHYVALNTAGLPFDTDGDGVSDYLEDSNGNGNGSDDATSWINYNSPNGLTNGSGLQVFTPLK